MFTTTATANTIAASGCARRIRRDLECEVSYMNCPIDDLKDSYECIDIQSNVESCGGCIGAGGMDCTSTSRTPWPSIAYLVPGLFVCPTHIYREARTHISSP
jgi:hypothetical protein